MDSYAREFITPESREHWLKLRTQDITSTECAALFSVSKYNSMFEIWHAKHDHREIPFEPNIRTIIGKHLEAGIAGIACELNNWTAKPMDCYARIPALKLGASFDWEITLESGVKAILEIKNVDYLVYKKEWINQETGEEEAPPHIELQVQHQMLASGYEWAVIFALVGGNQPVTLIRQADEKIQRSIVRRVQRFWHSIHQHNEPEPEYARDYIAIASIKTHVEAGKTIDTCPEITELVKAWHIANEAEKQASTNKKAAAGELIIKLGDAQYVNTPDYKVSCSTTRNGNRTCRVLVRNPESFIVESATPSTTPSTKG